MEPDFEVASSQWAPLREQARQRQMPLLVSIASRAIAGGVTWAQFEHETGLSRDYVFALVSGRRQTEHIHAESMQALAEFLDWPTIAVKAVAGQVRLVDFFTAAELAEQRETMAALLDAPELVSEPSPIAVFAGVLAGLHGEHRKQLRDIAADGPLCMH